MKTLRRLAILIVAICFWIFPTLTVINTFIYHVKSGDVGSTITWLFILAGFAVGAINCTREVVK